ncbi:MAG TPA: hypothetical protein VGK67_02985 [Myxococcales bacterium]|jgi:predicted hotdog family 3-hydroxylacyl-ACP dehydratase
MKPAPNEIPVERLLPHRPPMLVLERLAAWSPEASTSNLRLREGGLCFEAGRFRPLWCVELMAQAVAASVAYGAAIADEPREAAGFVVGIEDLRFGALEALVAGAELTIESRLDVDVPPAAELTARILAGPTEVAAARLRMLIGGARAQPLRPDAPRLEGFQGSSFEVGAGLVKIVLGAGHPWLDGHFPGAPVLPAVGQLRFVEHAASLLTGKACELESVERARFQEPIVPGDALELSLDTRALPRIDWTFRRGGRRVASGGGWLRG